MPSCTVNRAHAEGDDIASVCDLWSGRRESTEVVHIITSDLLPSLQ